MSRLSQDQGFGASTRTFLRVVAPELRLDVDKKLDRVPVRVLQISAVGDPAMVDDAIDFHALSFELRQGFLQLAVGRPDPQSEVAQPDLSPLRVGIVRLRDEQLVVSPATLADVKDRSSSHRRDLTHVEQIAVKMG